MKNLFLVGRIICILLYIASLIAWMAAGAWWWFVILLVLHFAEALLFGIRIGSKYGKSIGWSLLSTMLFGIFWWLAMDKGYIE